MSATAPTGPAGSPPNRRPLRILFAIDKFKGCLTSSQVAEAFAAGLRAGGLAFEATVLPVADGGDGLIAAFEAIDPDFQGLTRLVSGPLREPTPARFLRHLKRPEWILEMAQASGLALLPEPRRNPLKTSTRGTGELIAHALQSGAKRILLGIGGSATNDGGTGAAAAVGYRFLDRLDCPLDPVGGNLGEIARIDATATLPGLPGVQVQVACDVDNPLLGARGASAVYGPQKGADAAAVATLEAGLANLAAVIERDLGKNVRDLPGAGAAGGFGAGAVAFFGAKLKPGAELILDAVQFDARAGFADLVVTGEGRLDHQTVHGKAPWAVAQRARALGKPVIAVAGRIATDFFVAAGETYAGAWDIRSLAHDDADSMTRAVELLHELGHRLAMEIPDLVV
ncbi:MAG: glycerate kinase [Planctomycetota bacterium]